MELESYSDESGLHDGSSAVIIAGWIASREQWERFCLQWQKALNDADVSYLHMTETSDDARCRPCSEFFGWTRQNVNAYINTLIPIATRNAHFGLICAVPGYAYEPITEELRQYCQHPYVFALLYYPTFPGCASQASGNEI